MKLDEIRKIVLDAARKRFPDSEIVSVHLREDEDADGDPILVIRVVFDEKVGPPSTERAVGFVRRLIEALDAVDEHRFPHVSYVSKADAKIVKFEAA